ncbi:hypothetical protein SAMN04487983_1002269 [Streptomyces sp. yr375]|uniref:hypothetical protein n=1 Tax=Streptomyces sp. yr375 TaxID=1761906 RepID=UPI0008D248C2|nr:hypothetical protein [Streptomyces sp. yr375]SEP95658.1 hypothetical protein SAMN04487983_1002269 [Streptomyces sp. yr375]
MSMDIDMGLGTTRVELHIRRLVLDPAAAHVSRAALCAAVETELAVLLGLTPAPARVPVPVDGELAALARHIARAVHRAMATEEAAS